MCGHKIDNAWPQDLYCNYFHGGTVDNMDKFELFLFYFNKGMNYILYIR